MQTYNYCGSNSLFMLHVHTEKPPRDPYLTRDPHLPGRAQHNGSLITDQTHTADLL